MLSDSVWLVTHKGINYVIAKDTGILLAALPGKLMADPKKHFYAIASTNGCTRSALIYPNRNNVTLLAPNQFVPVSDGVTNFIVKDNRLYETRWNPFHIQQEVYNQVNLSIHKNTQLFAYDDTTLLLSNDTLQAIATNPVRRLWSFSDSFANLTAAGDTLIYSTTYGDVKAVSAREGAEIWQLKVNNPHSYYAIYKDKLIVASPAEIYFYSFNDNSEGNFRGASATIGKSQPGLTYQPDTCVRVVKDTTKSANRNSVFINKVDCKMDGAMKIGNVIPVSILPRGTAPEKLLAECNKNPDATSVITISSRIDDPNITAVCTK